MTIQTEVSTDVSWLQAKVRQLEVEAASIWAHHETYIVLSVALVVGALIGFALHGFFAHK